MCNINWTLINNLLYTLNHIWYTYLRISITFQNIVFCKIQAMFKSSFCLQIVEAKVHQLDFSLERIFLSLKEVVVIWLYEPNNFRKSIGD